MTGKIFGKWDETHSKLWSHQPIRLEHEMHKSPAFSMDELARLIENYPREHYSLVKTGALGSSRVWREGDIGNLSGRQVVEAISRGGLWLNLRDVTSVDRRYRDLVDQMFAEVAAHVPGFDAPTHQAGILISSPDAQVYYHADLPGQGLIQITGRKRVYLYPNTPPFVRPEHLEDIALFDVEVDIPYEPWYDRHAQVIDLEPGQMLNWPLNAPHRVENLGTVNISMTVSYVNQDIRRAQIVNLANGMLRHRFGYAPKSRSIRGPSYFGKAVMQKLLRDGKWLKRERTARRTIDFRLDADHPGEIVDLPKAA
jgi:Cupin-like domain